MNKKLILTSAIALALGSASAMGQVTYPRDIATEVDTDQGSVNLVEPVAFDFDTGAGSAPDEERFFRFELGAGATFNGDPSLVVDSDANSITGVRQSGGDGQDFVIFSVQETGEAITADGTHTLTANFSAPTLADIDIDSSQSDRIVFDFVIQGSEDSNALAINEASVIANDAITANTTPPKIDVREDAQQFDDGNVFVNLGTFELAEVAANTVYGEFNTPSGPFDTTTDGTDDLNFEDVFAEGLVTVSGDFGNVAEIRFFENATCSAAVPPVVGITPTAADKAAGEVQVDLIPSGGTHTGNICLEFDGGEIPQNTYSLSWEGVPNAGYESRSASGNLATLEKNGTTARANFLVGEDFPMFVRITNPSSIDGEVFVQLTNDAGQTARFPLGAITVGSAGGVSTTLDTLLGEGQATPAISVSELLTAAAGPDSNNQSFALSGTNKERKLRILVDAEFGEQGTPSAVRLDALSLSTNFDSFFQFDTDNYDDASLIRNNSGGIQ